MENAINLIRFILQSLLGIWPYLLITIPLAVAVQVSGVSRYINLVFNKKPIVSILLATLVGAFSPFCSCGVIPLITTLLIGGVPLAPVMSFWIASPSMDPELMPLSIATIGWNLSLWRMGATLTISLLSGIITHIATEKGFLDKNVLRIHMPSSQRLSSGHSFLTKITIGLKNMGMALFSGKKPEMQAIAKAKTIDGDEISCCVSNPAINLLDDFSAHESESCNTCQVSPKKPGILTRDIIHETWKAASLVLKFMTLAFLVNGFIHLYVPQQYLTNFLNGDNWYTVILAALIGIPTYTSNLLALPLIGGFLEMGMNPAAALAFLLTGPVTTIPAMIAVWGIAKRKVFFLYLAFSLVGAVVTGLLWMLTA